MEGIILYYAVSPVHVRNAKLLAPYFEDWKLRLAFEENSPWITENSVKDFESICFSADKVLDALWKGNVGAVVFSTAQPRKAPIALLGAAIAKGIPTIAIEESNQIALNQGTVNNYVLPVDHVLVASEHERRGMVSAGFPARRFTVSGWPFYSGNIGKADIAVIQQRKKQFGLDPERPVASLTLTGLHDAGESPEVRRRQLTLAAQGLPDEYQLVIKPHPIEKLQTLMPFVDECAPRAVVLEGKVSIEELLEASDILLNRGVSQVCIEALLQEIPVVVLDTGINTPFHLISKRVATDVKSLHRIIRELEDENGQSTIYEPFFKEHIPNLPDSARKNVCNYISEVACHHACDPNPQQQLFELALYQGWVGEKGHALQTIESLGEAESKLPLESLKSLLQRNAHWNAICELRDYFGLGFYSHILHSLWIDQLVERKRDIEEKDYQWLDSFPPRMQTVWFLSRIRSWALFLARTENKSRAKRFIDRVYAEHLHVPGIRQIREDTYLYMSSFTGRAIVHLKHISSMRLQKAFPWLVKWVQILRP